MELTRWNCPGVSLIPTTNVTKSCALDSTSLETWLDYWQSTTERSSSNGKLEAYSLSAFAECDLRAYSVDVAQEIELDYAYETKFSKHDGILVFGRSRYALPPGTTLESLTLANERLIPPSLANMQGLEGMEQVFRYLEQGMGAGWSTGGLAGGTSKYTCISQVPTRPFNLKQPSSYLTCTGVTLDGVTGSMLRGLTPGQFQGMSKEPNSLPGCNLSLGDMRDRADHEIVWLSPQPQSLPQFEKLWRTNLIGSAQSCPGGTSNSCRLFSPKFLLEKGIEIQYVLQDKFDMIVTALGLPFQKMGVGLTLTEGCNYLQKSNRNLLFAKPGRGGWPYLTIDLCEEAITTPTHPGLVKHGLNLRLLGLDLAKTEQNHATKKLTYSQAAFVDLTHCQEYFCQDCAQRFNSLELRQKHVLSCELRLNRRTCPVPDCKNKQVFANQWFLRRHMLVHSAEKKYKCEKCLKRFTRDYDRNRHCRTCVK